MYKNDKNINDIYRKNEIENKTSQIVVCDYT